MGLSRFRSAVTLLSDLLNLVEYLRLDNRRMRVVEHSSVFLRILPLLLVPNGIGVGFEVDRAAGVLLTFQNVNNSIRVPMIRIGSFRIRRLDPFLALIRSWVQDLLFLQLLCDLHRAAAFHAKIKDVTDDLGCFLINDPFLLVFGILPIAIRRICGQPFAAFTLGFVDRADLPAGVTGIELVEPHADSGKVIVHAVLILRVEVVIDGDVSDVVFGKSDVDEHAGHGGIAPKTGKVFCQNHGHVIRFDFIQHLLEAGAIKVRSAVSVINIENRIRKW